MDNIKVIEINSSSLTSTRANKKKLSKKQLYKEILSSSDRVKDLISKKKKSKRFAYLIQQPSPPPQSRPIQQPSPPPQSRPIQQLSQPSRPLHNTPTRRRVRSKSPEPNKITKYFKNPKSPTRHKSQRSNPPRRSNPRTLTKSQIVELISLMYQLNNIEETVKLHRIIRKLNKIQTNQTLFALRLINNNSNAPIAMLKNTLFNYISGQIKIIK